MADLSALTIALNSELVTQRNDALFALQSLIEYINAMPLLSVDLHKHDWTLEECLLGAKEMREYKAA